MPEKKEISQKITNYTIWYYLKYFPSINKLRQKLDMKFGPNSEKGKRYGGIFEDDIDYIIEKKLGNILVEKEIISSTIKNFITRGKNYYYITQKLAEKGFVKDEYEEILRNEFDCDNTSLLNSEKIYKQIVNLKKKNKSKNYIRNKFVDRKLDEPIVDGILAEVFISGEDESIKNELIKILKMPIIHTQSELQDIISGLSFVDRQKLTTKLAGKGFSFGAISDTLSSIQDF